MFSTSIPGRIRPKFFGVYLFSANRRFSVLSTRVFMVQPAVISSHLPHFTSNFHFFPATLDIIFTTLIINRLEWEEISLNVNLKYHASEKNWQNKRPQALLKYNVDTQM